MPRVTQFALLLLTACLTAGAYGALHDQISYTVSPDYYHAFKFKQFQIPPCLHSRIGAAVVGVLASWWMGVFIGVPILVAGFNIPDPRTYRALSLKAFGVVALTTLAVGLGALAFATLAITDATLLDFGGPAGVDKVAFARAGVMHNFSYLGGFLGVATGVAYVLFKRSRPSPRGLAS